MNGRSTPLLFLLAVAMGTACSAPVDTVEVPESAAPAPTEPPAASTAPPGTNDPTEGAGVPSILLGERRVSPAVVPVRAVLPNEVVGPLADGDRGQATVPDATTLTYRAFTIAADVRDTITATVETGPQGREAVVSLVDPNGRAVQFARGPGRITLTASVSAAGTYMLVLREQLLRSATFDVTVAVRRAAPLLVDGDACAKAAECASGKCTSGDTPGVTGICGSPRPDGATCTTYRDCSSRQCQGGVCVAPPSTWSVPPSLRGREIAALTTCGWAITLRFASDPSASSDTLVQATDCEYGDFCRNLYGRISMYPARTTTSLRSTSWVATRSAVPGMSYGQYTDSLEVADDPAGGTDLVVTATTTFRRSSNACPLGVTVPPPGSACKLGVPPDSASVCSARIPR